MSKSITEPLYFLNALSSRALYRGDAKLIGVSFMTVSAMEVLFKDGVTRLVPGPSLEENYYLNYSQDGLEFVPEGDYPLELPTRRLLVVDWSAVADKPVASLTWVIGTYSDGQKRKLAELTHGAIEAGVFKFLQINAVNRVLNQNYVEDKD